MRERKGMVRMVVNRRGGGEKLGGREGRETEFRIKYVRWKKNLLLIKGEQRSRNETSRATHVKKASRLQFSMVSASGLSSRFLSCSPSP